MAGIKYEEKIYFPDGHIYVLMDDEWGIEIIGENGIGGSLVGMGCWDFISRESWDMWGTICIEKIKNIKERFECGEITQQEVVDLVYAIENEEMPASIKNDLLEE